MKASVVWVSKTKSSLFDNNVSPRQRMRPLHGQKTWDTWRDRTSDRKRWKCPHWWVWAPRERLESKWRGFSRLQTAEAISWRGRTDPSHLHGQVCRQSRVPRVRPGRRDPTQITVGFLRTRASGDDETQKWLKPLDASIKRDETLLIPAGGTGSLRQQTGGWGAAREYDKWTRSTQRGQIAGMDPRGRFNSFKLKIWIL